MQSSTDEGYELSFMVIDPPIPAKESYFIALLKVYLDDIFGGHPLESTAKKQFAAVQSVLMKLDLRAKEAKDQPPNQQLIILGWFFDTVAQTVAVPKEKVQKYIDTLDDSLKGSMIRIKQVASHSGINAFARSLEVHILPWDGVNRLIPISFQLRTDLRFARHFLHLLQDEPVPFSKIVNFRREFTTEMQLARKYEHTNGLSGHYSTGEFFA